MGQPFISGEAIVLWKRKRKYFSTIAFLMKEVGIIISSVAHKRGQSYKNIAYLEPMSRVHITISIKGDTCELVQFDGIHMHQMKELHEVAYAALMGELITSIFEKGHIEADVYESVLSYCMMTQSKSIRLGTIILGYQLLSIAGFIPQKEDIEAGFGMEELKKELSLIVKDHESLSDELMKYIGTLILYGWDKEGSVSIPAALWWQLEKVLIEFISYQLGYELKSIQFMKTMNIISSSSE